MLAVRTNNDAITEKKKAAREDFGELKYGANIRLDSMDNFEEFRAQVEARSKSRRQFIRKHAGAEAALISNGETAMRYCGCQLIIATHSPFILVTENAKIYDFDDSPVSIKKWYELENTKSYSPLLTHIMTADCFIRSFIRRFP